MTLPAPATPRAAFTQGSILRHVVVSTLTGSVGVAAIFCIDLLSMFYVSLSGHDASRAAVSLMAKVLFFPYALNVGMTIGIVTVVSVAVGRGDGAGARRAAVAGLLASGLQAALVALIAVPLRSDILHLFGAQGEAFAIAVRLLGPTLPVNVLLALGMGLAGILRASGQPTRAMLVTLAGALATVVSDPFFIFGLGQGVDGVAPALVVSRITFVAVGLWLVIGTEGRAGWRPRAAWADLRPILRIAGPAILANLALPFGDWYVTRTLWSFGLAASAAGGVFDRLMPAAFAIVFALTMSIGPILGQNLGARAFDRVRLTFLQASAFAGLYGLVVWVAVCLSAASLADLFGLSGSAAAFFTFLCRYATLAWVFASLLFVANAVFNTLGRANISTLFNWGRATLGTMVFVWWGARNGGAETAVMGIAAAAAAFGLGALALAGRYIAGLDPTQARPHADAPPRRVLTDR